MCDLTASLNVKLTSWKCTNGIPVASVCSGSTSTWTGVTCTSGDVTAIDIRSNSLLGTLSSTIGLLTSLTLFRVGTNDITGTIPTSLGYLVKLGRLGLGITSISGTVPTELGYLSQLYSLALDINSLTGTVPSSLCQLSALTTLLISSSRFSCYASCLLTVTSFSYGNEFPCTETPTISKFI